MLRQCIKPNQKDWVLRLPAIEFAINSARSESTGFAPFFLNSGRMPRSLIWDSNQPSQYPGVRVFAQQMKSAVMQANTFHYATDSTWNPQEWTGILRNGPESTGIGPESAGIDWCGCAG
jgi:hypothetical protein